MALPSTNISVAMVKAELGASTNDVGRLCIHPNINKWSKWKPVRHNSVNPLTEENFQSVKYGINPINEAYERPRGKNETYNEPFRLGDFRGYNHQALPPVWVDVVAITGFGITTGQQPPYNLKAGQSYTIEARFVAGDIDPKYIDATTDRIKNTSTGGGYGGLAWTYRPHMTEQITIANNRVFSAVGIGGATHTFSFTAIQSGGSGETLRVEYLRYTGTTNNTYLTVGKEIMQPNYRDLITISPIYTGFNQSTSLSLFYNSIANVVDLRAYVYNNETFDVQVYYKVQYTHLGTGISYEATSSPLTIAGGFSGGNFTNIIGGWSNGQNNYRIDILWMFFKDNHGNEFVLDTRSNELVSIFIETQN